MIVEAFRRELDALLASPRYVFLREQGYRMVAWHPPSVIFERERA